MLVLEGCVNKLVNSALNICDCLETFSNVNCEKVILNLAVGF
jgi:hypothetical protein